MQLKVSNNLDKLTVLANQKEAQWFLEMNINEPIEITSFVNPKLLTDLPAIARLDPSTRDLVFALYGSYPREVLYDDVSCSFSPSLYPGVWGPSIDTIWMAKCVKQFLNDDVQTIAEVGCGSGYLTKFILHHANNCTSATLTDIDLTALNCASDNLASLNKSELATYVMPHKDDQTLGLKGQYDLIISNPPYIPRPNENSNNPYEGLSVIKRLADNIEQLLTDDGALYINISTVSGNDPIEWFKKHKVLLVDDFKVPLKVNAVTNNISPASKKWLEYLKDNKLVEYDDSHPDYHWYHTLRFYQVKR